MFREEPLMIKKQKISPPPPPPPPNLERTEVNVKQFLDFFTQDDGGETETGELGLQTGELVTFKSSQKDLMGTAKKMQDNSERVFSDGVTPEDVKGEIKNFRQDLKFLWSPLQDSFLFRASVIPFIKGPSTNTLDKIKTLPFEQDFKGIFDLLKGKYVNGHVNSVLLVNPNGSKKDDNGYRMKVLQNNLVVVQLNSNPLDNPLYLNFTNRKYHMGPLQTPEVLVSLFNSIARDYYCLVDFATNICFDTILHPKINNFRIPHQKAEGFRIESTDPSEQLKILGEVGQDWFVEDYPFMTATPLPQETKRLYQQLYCLSCLDKASFFFNFGPHFHQMLGYDKNLISNVNPFQVGPGKLKEEEQSDAILDAYRLSMGELTGTIDTLKDILTRRIAENRSSGLFVFDGFLSGSDGRPAKVTEAAYLNLYRGYVLKGGPIEDNDPRKKVAGEIKKEFERYINDDIITPIQNYLKKLDGYTDVLTAKRVAESKVKSLERQILQMKENGVSPSSSEKDDKKEKSYNEMLVRMKITELLKGVPVFNFVEKVASQTSKGVCFRFNIEDHLVNHILNTPLTVSINEHVIQKFNEEISKPPLKDCLGNGGFMTPGLEQVVGQTLANVKRMLMKGRGGGKTNITNDDLRNPDTPDLLSAYVTVISLQLARVSEVQKKVSSTLADKNLLDRTFLEADLTLRAMLIKHKWMVWENSLREG